MKTREDSFLPAFRRLACLAMTAAALFGATAAGTAAIVNVVETGGDNEPTDTITAKWTGQTFPISVANEPVPGAVIGNSYTVGAFGSYAPAFVDRNHRYTNAVPAVMPPYLVGQEYIMCGNDNRDNGSYRLDVTVGSAVEVYMLIDNRMGPATEPTANANDPPTFGASAMQWILDQGWAPVLNGLNRFANASVPDEVGIDESADGTINQYYSLYKKAFPAGTFSLFQPDNAGRNMYGVVVVTVSPPNAPTGLIAVSGDAKVTLTWSGTGDGFIVKRAASSGGPYEDLATVTTTSYVDQTAVNGSTYYYVVSAYNAQGNSPDSNEAVGRPKAAPSGVVAVGGINQVQVQWNALAGAASYTVKRSASSGGPYADVVTGLTGTSFTDTSVQSGTTYFYVVIAQLTVGGDSGQSDEAAGTTVPSAPNLTGSLFAATAIRLGWTITAPVLTQFQIERSTDGASFAPLATVPANQRTYIDSGLAASTTYFYRIRAQNATGPSPYSAVASNTTPSGGWNVNFATGPNNSAGNPVAPTPPGYLQDIGELFGVSGAYGWNTPAGTNVTRDARYRQSSASPDLRYDTFNHLQKGVGAGVSNAYWEIDVPNGFYLVRIAAGDATAVDSVFQFDIEGIITGTYTPVAGAWWGEFTNAIIVSDGRLTVNSGPAASNNKICFIDIYPAVPTLASIGTQPQSQTVLKNRPVTFSVVVANAADPVVRPVFYQWYAHGTEVAGAKGDTLSIPLAQLGDSGEYYVVITNYAGAVTSSVAQLVVNDDTLAPVPLSVGSVDGFKIGVCFDEILDTNSPTPTGIDFANYFINEGAVNVVGAIFRPDGRSVELTLEPPIAGGFTVRIENVQDLAGNGLATPVTLTGEVFGLAQDVGAPLAAGSHYSCAADALELVGGGTDIGGTSDEGHFAFKIATGDFDVRVRLDSLTLAAATTPGTLAEAGLMVRSAIEPVSPTLHLLANAPPPGRNQLEAGVRTTVNGSTASWGTALPGVGASKLWLRLTRSGNNFLGYWSSNGVAWGQFASTTLALPEALAVGPVVCAHTNLAGLVSTAAFSNFRLSGLCAGTPPVLTNLSYTAGPPAQFSFQFASESGCTYLVEYKDNLEAASWTLLTTLPGTGGLITITDSGAEPKRFYRVRLP